MSSYRSSARLTPGLRRALKEDPKVREKVMSYFLSPKSEQRLGAVTISGKKRVMGTKGDTAKKYVTLEVRRNKERA